MNEYHILVELQAGTLKVMNRRGDCVDCFPVISGRNSHRGPKEQEGDQRTPRGAYYICTINRQSRFTLFFGISYPSPADGKRGLENKTISDHEYRQILEAWHKGLRPPWDTQLGGQVGIHGGGIDRDGTRGCIGMRDEDIKAMEKYMEMGTRVEIAWNAPASCL